MSSSSHQEIPKPPVSETPSTGGLLRIPDFGKMRPSEVLEFLCDNKLPVYIVNKTKKPASILALSFTSPSSGKTTSVNIPVMPYPYCLTDEVHHELIRGNRDVLTYAAKGVIEIMSPKTARDMIDEDAEKIIQRQKDKLRTGSTLGRAPVTVVTDSGSQNNEPSPHITTLVSRFEANAISANELLLELKATAHLLTSADLNIVISKVDATRVRDWAKAQQAVLTKMEAAEADED